MLAWITRRRDEAAANVNYLERGAYLHLQGLPLLQASALDKAYSAHRAVRRWDALLDLLNGHR
jgi:hypothetical protein